MPISGYDPDDIDDDLESRLSKRDVADYLSDEEIDRWNEGESLLKLLEEDDIERLLDREEIDAD